MIKSIKVSEDRKAGNIRMENEMPVEKRSDFWTREEINLFKDIERIDKAKLLWPEKKFYITLATSLYSQTNYYQIANSIGEVLGWIVKSPKLEKIFSIKQDENQQSSPSDSDGTRNDDGS